MFQLASIQLNYKDGGGDVGVFAADISHWTDGGTSGTLITFRDGRPPIRVSETVTQVQAAINALWDQYAVRGNTTAAYTPTNVTPDRAYDADATSTAELGDVLGTLISDLQSLGLIG